MSEWIDIKLPEGQQEGTVAVVGTWYKKAGDAVTRHEPILEIETDKVNTEVAASTAGILAEILIPEGQEVGPEDILGRIQTGTAKEPDAPDPETPVTHAKTTKPVPTGRMLDPADRSRLLSPSVRRLVGAHNLNISQIEGSGRGGRITYNDVQCYLKNRDSQPPDPAAAPGAMPVTALSGPIPSRVVPHDTMRRRIADHMVTSLLKTAPHVTSVFEMDLSAIMAHRKAHKQPFAAKGVNLTFTAYFVAASVAALQTVPEVNSRFHADGLEIFTDYNIGVGTALGDKGLIVPVIHHAQHHNLFGIASRLQDVTEKARAGKLSPADVQGGTFTISNHGVSGSLIATPIIINQPQSAILGIGKMQKRVMVIEADGHDSIQIRPMSYVTLSIDHRALDAHQTNAFLTKFVAAIEGWQ